MKTGFVADGDKNFLVAATQSLTLSGYQVSSFQTGNELINALVTKPSLVIIGNLADVRPLQAINKVRKELRQAFIVHMANSGADAVASIREGSTEFIERNGAEFVRLRTLLDIIEKQRLKTSRSVFQSLKKVFVS